MKELEPSYHVEPELVPERHRCLFCGMTSTHWRIEPIKAPTEAQAEEQEAATP